MFAPERGCENPVIRQALALCDGAGINVTYHEDTIEVRFGVNNTRFYTLWPHFLADVRALFGDRMSDGSAPEPAPAPPPEPVVAGFGSKGIRHADIRKAPPAKPGPTAEQVRALKAEIRLLERAIKVVGMQRDEWQKEAESLRQELETTRTEIRYAAEARGALSSGPDRYKQVRQIIVRRLHPDVFGTDEEKKYREKLFKTIWGEIEQLDKA